MSWIDQVNTEFSIITGDGKEYKPNWLNASRSVEFNASTFEYPEVSGSFIRRRLPKGLKYNLEIYFQGEDHLEVAEAFRISANDPRAWTITHPFYGTMIVQPLNLNFDNTQYNVSEIKGTIAETLTQDNPKITVDAKDKITTDKENVDDQMANDFIADVPEIDVETSEVLEEQTADFFNIGNVSILTTVDAEAYLNLFNEANTALLNVTNEPLAAIRAIQAFVRYPSQFADTVVNRVNTLVQQFESLSSSVTSLVNPAEKKTYEMNGGAVISTITLASITEANYGSRVDVFNIMEQITDAYEQYLTDLDSLQTDNGGEPESYMPNVSSMIELDSLVTFCIANLFDIALDSKQERSILCEEDTNVILLAHRFYGLNQDDSTIQKIIDNNGIGLEELTGIRKGRRIIFYV